MARVDERLIHGQIINEWVALTNPTHLLILDEVLVADEFMANIYKALAPLWLEVQIFAPTDSIPYLCALSEDSRIFLLAKNPQPFEELLKRGIPLEEVVLADKAYLPNKIKLPLASKCAINALLAAGVQVITRNFPTDVAQRVQPYKL